MILNKPTGGLSRYATTLSDVRLLAEAVPVPAIVIATPLYVIELIALPAFSEPRQARTIRILVPVGTVCEYVLVLPAVNTAPSSVVFAN
jgi:hypothetical protein